MRFAGLTLCLIVSTLTARAESVEERVTALEARVKALEQALLKQEAKPAATSADGTYQGRLPNGDSFTLELSKGRLYITTEKDSKTGTYEVDGTRLIATVDGKTEFLQIDGDRLRNAKIEAAKTK